MKSVTIYHIDGVKTLEALIQLVGKEFPGVSFEKVKITFGYVSILLEANINEINNQLKIL